MEQLKIGTNDLPSVAKKKVAIAVASVSSMEAFPTMGLPSCWRCPRRQRPVSGARRWGRSLGTLSWMAVVASIHLKAVVATIHLEVAMVAMLEATWLRETLPTASQEVGPYENPVT